MKKIFYLLAGLVLTQSVWAWGPMGHRIVAEVAYHYLSSKTTKSVDNVLGKHGMVYWCTWPDELKSDPTLYTGSFDWHFQDLAFGLSSDQLALMRRDYPSHGGNLWTTLDQLLTQLPLHPDTVSVNSVMMPYHDALVFLVHLTADELCPMHMAREEDQGGNMVKLTWNETPTNLHKLWDEKMIESRKYSYSEYAQMLVDTYGAEKDSIAGLSELDFVNLVYSTTQSIYDYQTKGKTDSYHYMWEWKTTCDRLLFMAGVRLANHITAIL